MSQDPGIFLQYCQLQVIYDASTSLGPADRLQNWALRLRSYLQDHLEELGRRGLWRQPGQRHAQPVPGGQFAPPAMEVPGLPRTGRLAAGDIVGVLSREELRRTLDAGEAHDGLRLLKPMWDCCGRQYVVLKRVHRIFDERRGVMVRVRDTVLLKDAICDGHYMVDREGCDRSCYFFWKTAWLRRVS